MRQIPGQQERCPVCHRKATVDATGKMMPHQSGSQQCSGTGQPGPTLARKLKHDAQNSAMAIALAQFLVLVDATQGTVQPATDRWSPPEHKAWKEWPFIEDARAALFAAVQGRPELLEGTSLVVKPYDPEEAAVAGVLEGPGGDR